MKKFIFCLVALQLLLGTALTAQVIIKINTGDDRKPVSPYLIGKNNSLSDNPSHPLTSAEWQRLKDMGIMMFRENGGNNSTKYNWRRKLSSHPDWYNNVYFHDWDFAAASLQNNIPSAQGMWAFQLIGKAAKTSSANFNDWAYNRSQWWKGVGQNLAGGGQLNTDSSHKALVEGNPSLYLEDWNADSTTGILNHWFGMGGIVLNPDKIVYWSMDNEPEIWEGTHDDVWPEQPDAEQFMQMYFSVAKKARSLFPGIKLLGPVPANEWQWYNWDGASISYDGKNYVWLEYFIKRVADEQQASGLRLLDVLDIHFYPGETSSSQITQLHRVFFDTTYNYPGANGVRRLGSNITKEYILKRCSDWLLEYMGQDHGVTFSVSETSIAKKDDPDLNAVWYASVLGEFARHGVEIFTPWDWTTGMSEVAHLFSRYGQSYILPSESSQENTVSAYPTINVTGDSMTIFLVNRDLANPKTIELNLNGFYIKDGDYSFYSLSDLPVSETFVSLSTNGLHRQVMHLSGNWIDLTLDPLSVSAIVLVKDNSETGFNIAQSLIDSAATQETMELYRFMQNQFGRRIISGQTHDYYNQLKSVAGKSPMLRAGDFQHFTQGYPYLWDNGIGGHTYGYDGNDGTVNSLINWYNNTGKKGIVSMHWHWHDPLGDSTSNVNSNTFYTDTTEFDIRRAVIPGTLEYNCVIRDIDSIAFQLKKFQNAGIPVLWRPLHEAGGGWFWWGAHGAEPCLALWDILIERLRDHHGLHNLIWVWSSPEPGWYPGNDKADILGYDSYPGSYNYTNQKVMFDNLQTITGGEKLIAMTENGPIPDPDNCFSGDAPWLYFMSWSDLVVKQNSEAHIIDVYSNPAVLSLEPPAPPKLNVTLRVLRDLTLEPLNANSVLLGGVTGVTNTSGEANFQVTAGNYNYIVTRTSYDTVTGAIEIVSDTTITLLLHQTHANIRIRLREGTRPVTNAFISINTDTLISSSLGDALFSGLQIPGIFAYSVKKDGYEDITGDVLLTRDTTVLLQMTKVIVGINSPADHSKISVWPNPANDYLNIALTGNEKPGEITIMNSTGEAVKKFDSDTEQSTIKISDLPPGTYIIHISTDRDGFISRFTKLP